MFGSPNFVLTAIVIIGLNVAVSLLALWAVRRLVPNDRLAPHNDVAGFVYAVIGVVYAVIMAFVLINVWEDYSQTEDDARREAGALGNLHRLAEGLPDASRQEIQDATLDYALTVVDDEWPRLLDGNLLEARDLAHTDALWSALYRVEPASAREEALYAAALDQVDTLSSHRRARFVEAGSGLLGVLWAVMIGGGILTVLFPCLFGVENGVVHALIVAILAATIGLLLLTVYELDSALEGEVHIDPDGFELVLEQFEAGRP